MSAGVETLVEGLSHPPLDNMDMVIVDDQVPTQVLQLPSLFRDDLRLEGGDANRCCPMKHRPGPDRVSFRYRL